MRNAGKLFAVLLTFFVVSAQAETVFVESAKGTGLGGEESLVTVTELVKSAVREHTKHKLVDDQKKSQLMLRANLLKLGSSYIMTLEKYHAGDLKYSSQMKARNFEEMDNVATRLVRAVLDEAAAKADTRVDDVTENEQVAGTRRKDTVNRWNFGFGPASTYNLNESDMLLNWNLGFNWEIDPSFALKLFYDGTTSRANQLGIGVNYFLNNKNTSPILFGSLGYGTTTIRDTGSFLHLGESKTGFALGGGAGFQFFRTSRVNLEILLHVTHYLAANRIGAPGTYGLRLSLYW